MRILLWNRSTWPVVVGERGAVSRWVIPFSRQIRSNSTSPGRARRRPVNTVPLSVRTSSGRPQRRIASPNAPATARADSETTTAARTQNTEPILDPFRDIAGGSVRLLSAGVPVRSWPLMHWEPSVTVHRVPATTATCLIRAFCP